MRTNYMMTVDDVMEELGVKRSKAYSILKQLNAELVKEGYVAVRGKIPCTPCCYPVAEPVAGANPLFPGFSPL